MKNNEKILNEYNKDYRSLHQSVRKKQKRQYKIDHKIKKLEKEINNLKREGDERIELSSQIPSNWKLAHEEFKKLSNNKKKSLTQYRRNVDEVYENIQILKSIINDKDKLNKIEDINNLQNIVMNQSKEEAMKFMKS